MKQEQDNKIRIIPLGGLGAIGCNMTLFEYHDEMIIVDCGIMFPTEEMPGIDFVIPDLSYVIKNRQKVKGIIITHGHEDHIGAVPFLLQEVTAPLFATKLTLGFIQSRLEERPPREMPTFVEILPGTPLQIGSFLLDFIRVNHSIIDGVGLAIQTPIGTIIHSGDFKIDFSPMDGRVTELSRFSEYGEKGVLLLMSDSTNALRKGYTRSENVLAEKLTDIFSAARGRIIVASFASNIHRIQQVLDVAAKYNRKVVVSGITMLKNVEIAKNLGYLSYREGLIIDIKEAGSVADRKLVVICTGSQGEPMSALSRMAAGTHKHFTTAGTDTVIITASVIPGNERMVNTVVNSLMRQGADVYYEQDGDIHVSGHAAQEELKLMITLCKPRFFMPIHGEYRHLKAHSEIAESLKIKPSRIKIAENGSILELTKKSFEKTGTLHLNQIFVDGNDIEDLGSNVIKERKTMSSEGMVLITAVCSDGMLLRQPDVITRGFITSRNSKINDILRRDAEEQLHKLLADGLNEKDIVPFLKKNLRNSIYKLTRRNPLIEVRILEV
ncbi:MAG TPA: ribonuclease J [Spirochaetes bacterium]|nr:ribonuclease J [Spirochaetota bacterium]